MWLKRVGSSMGIILLSVSVLNAQFAEDALRFSQLGLGVGAKTLSIGSASVGSADDYSALFLNPAGLALIRDYEFSVGLSHQIYDNKVSYLGSTSSLASNATNLNNLGIVYPIPTTRGSLTFAFGVGRVSNYTTASSVEAFSSSHSIIESMIPNVNLWSMSANARNNLLDENIPYQLFLAEIDSAQGKLYSLITGNVNQKATVREGGGLNNWSLGGAMDIARDLSLGVTLTVVSGLYTYDRVFTESDDAGLYQTQPSDLDHFTLEQTIKSNVSGYNALMYRKQGRDKFGITVRTPTILEMNEDFTSSGRSVFDNGDRYSLELTDKTSYKVLTPTVFGAGGSVQLGEWLVLAADAEYIDWTQMEFRDGSPDLISENRLIQKLFKPTTNLRGGAELTLWNYGVKLRGGVVMNPSPYVGDPSSFNQLYYTGGAGIALDQNVTLNLAYAYGTWKSMRDNYYIGSIISRSQERITTNTVNVTLSYRF
jgi:hypothetical protein